MSNNLTITVTGIAMWNNHKWMCERSKGLIRQKQQSSLYPNTQVYLNATECTLGSYAAPIAMPHSLILISVW